MKKLNDIYNLKNSEKTVIKYLLKEINKLKIIKNVDLKKNENQ